MFSISLVRFPLMLEIITARVASRMRCLLICFEKWSRPGAVPPYAPSPSSMVASGNMDMTAERTFSGSSLGLTGHEMLTWTMLGGWVCAYLSATDAIYPNMG